MSCISYPMLSHRMLSFPGFLFPALSYPILYHHYHHHHQNHTTNNHNSNTHHNHNHHHIHVLCPSGLVKWFVRGWCPVMYLVPVVRGVLSNFKTAGYNQGSVASNLPIIRIRKLLKSTIFSAMLQKLHSDHSSQNWRSMDIQRSIHSLILVGETQTMDFASSNLHSSRCFLCRCLHQFCWILLAQVINQCS